MGNTLPTDMVNYSATKKTERNKAREDARLNENLLKSSKASLRAKMGSMGISSMEEGSTQATIKGLEEETVAKNKNIFSTLKQKLRSEKRKSIFNLANKIQSLPPE